MNTFLHHESGFIFHFNSDMSGDVTIVGRHQGSIASSVAIPASALLAFLAEHIRSARISELESMTTDELLGL